MPIPSPEFRDVLRTAFGVKKPKIPEQPATLPIHDVVEKPEPTRGINDPLLAYEAQRIYSPDMPPSPLPGPVKPPTTPQVNRGTVGGMDNTGPWGGPQEK